MEVFQVFATMSLVDMISSPLRNIQTATGDVDRGMASLSTRFSVLARSMLPIAIAAAVIISSFTACIGSAMAFQNAMADVAKVVNFTSETEMAGMSSAILDMSGKIPMAADGIAAIIASAAQSGVAKNDLLGFTEQAAKMGVAFDLTGAQAGKMMADWRAGMNLTLPQTYALADSVNHLSNNMNATAPAIGEVLQRVGALAIQAGLAETEVAALGAAFLSSGTSPEIASTALKKFTSTLTKGAAMSKTQADAFESLGFSAVSMASMMQKDAKGVIFDVLNTLSDVPKELHMSLLTQMFGEEAIGAIAPLLGNMGNLSKAFELIGDSASYAGSMQKEFEARSATAENAIILLKNKFTAFAVTVGTYFLPFVSSAATALGYLVEGFRMLAASPVGEFFINILAHISAIVVTLALFGGAWWAIVTVMPMVSNGLIALKLVVLGLSTPMLVLIGIVSALYLAYRTNFGGIADTIDSFFSTISMVFQGVMTLFRNIEDGSSSITGDLAKNIHKAGLTEFVLGLFKTLNRLKTVFVGVFSGITNVVSAFFTLYGELLSYIIIPINILIDCVGFLITKAFGGFGSTELGGWQTFGEIIGSLVGIFIALATPVAVICSAMMLYRKIVMGITAAQLAWNIVSMANPIVFIIMAIIVAIGLLIYYFDDIVAGAIWLGSVIADFFSGIWDSIVNGISFAYDGIVGFFSNIASSITGFFSGINLYDSGVALLTTFKDGIMNSFTAVKDTVFGALQSVRDMLPFSDAKEGPLSSLTLSGTRLLTTIGEGVTAASPNFISTLANTFSGILPNLENVGSSINGFFGGLFSDDPAGEAMNTNSNAPTSQSAMGEKTNGGTSYIINIENISLPNVENGDDFIGQLQAELTAYGV